MPRHGQTLLIFGFTAIFVGTLTVWLVGPGAGLSFLGIELGEWLKFTGLGARRDLFYLPPITLAAMLVLWTVTWPDQSWRAWALRGLAILVSLLAFPAVADITGPVREQYTMRVIWIGLVGALALFAGFWRPRERWRLLPWLFMGVLGAIGLLLPTWMFGQIRPFLTDLFGWQVTAGMGLWLNGLGHGLVLLISLLHLSERQRSVPVEQNGRA